MFTKVVGVTHKNGDGTSRQKILKKMRREGREGETVYLEHEPDNPFDENAVKVLNTDSEQLGYLSSELAEDIVERVANGEVFNAVISEFTGGDELRPTVGCNLEITSEQVKPSQFDPPWSEQLWAESSRSKLSITQDDWGLLRVVALAVFIALIVVMLHINSVKNTNASSKSWVHPYLRDGGAAQTESVDKEAEARMEAQREARKKANAQELYELRKKLTSTFDEVERVKWIYEKTTKRLIDRRTSRKNFFYVYLGQSGSVMWPRLRMGFIRDGWIFFEKVIVNIDGNVTQLSFRHFDVKRDVLSGNAISEYADVYADMSTVDYGALIKSMSKGKKVVVRFEGDQYRHDFTMTKEQKNALWNVWRVYELMR